MRCAEFLGGYPVIKENLDFSLSVIDNLRRDLAEALRESEYKEKITIVATGSYGRKEASTSSDLDLFIFFDSDRSRDILSAETEAIRCVVKRYIEKDAGDTGTFGVDAVVNFNEMLVNIGGNNDSNITLTRRMLFLLEGTWLYGEGRFNSYRADLLAAYIKPGNPQNQISRFLLNDIIRYYRTITTDFEHKVAEGNKSWGLRNVKLRFSRKILYFGGILCIAETALKSNSEKNAALAKLLDHSVLERILCVGESNSHTQTIFGIYQDFLCAINDSVKRGALDDVTREGREGSPIFLEMRAKSKEFSVALTGWLKEQYQDVAPQEPHPIHGALLF